MMIMFQANQKVIIIGEREGVPAPTIQDCIIDGKCQVLYAVTECAVGSVAGSLDEMTLQKVAAAAGQDLLVILGSTNGDMAVQAFGEIMKAGQTKNIYHVCEQPIKELLEMDKYEEEIGMMEMILDVADITEQLEHMRSEN